MINMIYQVNIIKNIVQNDISSGFFLPETMMFNG